MPTVDHLLLTEEKRSAHRGRFESLSLGFCTIHKQRASIHLSLLPDCGCNVNSGFTQPP